MNLSDLRYALATVGANVRLNQSVGRHTLTLAGTTYSTGVGVQAPSSLIYSLAGKYASFTSDVGVDAEETDAAKIEFKVIGDNKVLFDSGLLAAGQVAHVSINLSGIYRLTLQTLTVGNTAKGSTTYLNHADWAGAQLGYISAAGNTRSSQSTSGIVAAAGVSATPAGLLDPATLVN